MDVPNAKPDLANPAQKTESNGTKESIARERIKYQLCHCSVCKLRGKGCYVDKDVYAKRVGAHDAALIIIRIGIRRD